jgi:hypothetical protein
VCCYIFIHILVSWLIVDLFDLCCASTKAAATNESHQSFNFSPPAVADKCCSW